MAKNRHIRKKGFFWLLLWIALTVAACILLSFLIALVMVAIGTAGSIITKTNTYEWWNQTPLLGILLLIAYVVVGIISKKLWNRFNAQCDACKKFGTLEYLKTEVESTDQISIRMELEDKNWKGDVIGTHDQYIPGQRTTYIDTYRCKHCGHYESYMRRVDSPNV